MPKKRKKKVVKKKPQHLPIEVLRQMLTFVSASLAFVSALAWNGAIQDLVGTYIKKYMPVGSTTISLFLYAVIVTTLAIVVTINLSHAIEKLDALKD